MKSRHESFEFASLDRLLKKVDELGIELPYQESIEPLFKPLSIGLKKIPNRMTVQPMEGFDAESDGSPSELTFRRYQRYAQGGSGLIWFEATSVVPEGRSNPHQLMMTPQNMDFFTRLVEQTRYSATREFGSPHETFLVLQLTHSGRYSKPEGKSRPVKICFNPFLDKQESNQLILSDEELDRLQDHYLTATQLAKRAGFDAVDIKACHGYLLNELLAAHTRKESRYGGSFENRSRFLTNVIQRVQDEIPEIFISVRLSATGGTPYPYGFGVSDDGSSGIDLTEPQKLINRLISIGCSFFNITVGNPHTNPHLGRPYDRPLRGSPVPAEHPLEGIARMYNITAKLQKIFPRIPFVGSGYSWLRHFFPFVGAAAIQSGDVSLIGLGRSSFAYPKAPRDLMDRRTMDPKKVCITCSRCTELMRGGQPVGCVIRDHEIYGKLYQKLGSEGR